MLLGVAVHRQLWLSLLFLPGASPVLWKVCWDTSHQLYMQCGNAISRDTLKVHTYTVYVCVHTRMHKSITHTHVHMQSDTLLNLSRTVLSFLTDYMRVLLHISHCVHVQSLKRNWWPLKVRQWLLLMNGRTRLAVGCGINFWTLSIIGCSISAVTSLLLLILGPHVQQWYVSRHRAPDLESPLLSEVIATNMKWPK